MAAQAGHYEVAKILLKHGADPDLMDAFGSSAMKNAKAENHEEIMTLILDLQGMDAQENAAVRQKTVAEEAALKSAAVAELAAANAGAAEAAAQAQAMVSAVEELLAQSKAMRSKPVPATDYIDQEASANSRSLLFGIGVAISPILLCWSLCVAKSDRREKKGVTFASSPDFFCAENKVIFRCARTSWACFPSVVTWG
jgi:hypothetical protein